MPTGYIPIYKITRGGIDITGRFSDRCVSLRVDFSAGEGQEDSCTIIMDDRGWAIARPTEGEVISIYLGYKEIGLAFMGSYEIEEVHFTYPPKGIMLKGTSSGADTFLKVQINQEFKGKTLGELFEAMAKKGGITAEVHPDLKDKQVDFRNMIGSPYTLIQGLERQFGAVAKIANGRLQVIPRDKGQNSAGEQMPTVVLGPEHFGAIDVKHANKSAYGKVRAAYLDPKDYVTRFVESTIRPGGGNEGLTFTPSRKFNNREEAQAAADAQMQSLNRSLGEASMSLAKGDPWLHDQQRILIRGMRDGINGSYVADLVSHVYVKDAGITTEIHANPPADAQDFESMFDNTTDQDKRRLFLDPGPGGLIGTVLDRVVTGRPLTVEEIINGANPLDGLAAN